MGIRLRKTVRRMMLLFVACSTFIIGSAAFYLYAGAAAFLFTPKQPTPETTPTLIAQAAVPAHVYPLSFTFSTPEYQYSDYVQPACTNCIQDDLCGLCEPIKGEYENKTFSYALTIPDELYAMKAPAPATDYGFIARLSADPAATVEVEGTYNEESWSSLIEAVNDHTGYLNASSTPVVVLKNNTARLGKLPARRFVVQYIDNVTGLSMIEDKTIAFRKFETGKENWTVYAVTLRTRAERYEKNLAALEKVIKRWKEIELAHY